MKHNSVLVFSLSLLGCLFFSGCLDSGKKATKPELIIVNVLDKNLYDDCHIKGSIQVPYEDLEDYANKHWDKNTSRVVIYCANKQCSASLEGAKLLVDKLGFQRQHVWAYEGGSAAAIKEGVPVEGPCKESYLNDYQEVTESENEGIQIISSENLKKMMKEFATF